MKLNMGTVDKSIRLVLAAIAIALYYTGAVSGNTAIILLLLAIVFAMTSVLNFCPLYLPFGISTRKKIKDNVSATDLQK